VDFTEAALADPQLRDLLGRVEMVLAPDVDAAYPGQWSAVVDVETRDGRRLSQRVAVPKGDPGNRLTKDELETKFRRLAQFAGAASAAEAEALIGAVRSLEERRIEPLLAAGMTRVRAGAAR
jgi:2-methylcitrate dehydratase PrpD